MQKPVVSIIAAVGRKTLAIGANNDLLWPIPDDLKRFRKLTLGHPVIMGRKTFESIGKALPGRENIVVTRNQGLKIKGCQTALSFGQALEMAKTKDKEEIFIIGGGEIYKIAWPFADKLYLTLVDDDKPGDVFFPDWQGFGATVSQEKRTDEKTGLKYSWIEVVKKAD